MRLHMKHQPVLQVSAWFPILEYDERRNAQYRNHVLQENIYGDTEHLPLQESAEHVHHDCQAEDHEQILELHVQKSHFRREISWDWCHRNCHKSFPLVVSTTRIEVISFHLTPAVPLVTKNSPSLSRPETMRHRMAPRKCRVWLNWWWTCCSNSPPNFNAPTATCIPAYTGRMTFANQSTRFNSEFQ